MDDYAFYVAALTELYHSTLESQYLEKAEAFCREAVSRFADAQDGGFFLSDPGSTELFMNPKETYDGAVPSGNSVMAYNLVRLYQLTGKEVYEALAEKQILYLSARAREDPAGHGMFLLAKQLLDNPPEHLVIALKKEADLDEIKERLPCWPMWRWYGKAKRILCSMTVPPFTYAGIIPVIRPQMHGPPLNDAGRAWPYCFCQSTPVPNPTPAVLDHSSNQEIPTQ